MPPITRWFIKTALLYLVLALCSGIFLAFPTANPIAGLFPVYFHLLTFGWLTQLIFGVALWMFPRYSSTKPRGHEWLGWATFIMLNIGLLLRAVFEPLSSSNIFLPFSGWMLVIAALVQWLAGLAFVANTWARIKEK